MSHRRNATAPNATGIELTRQASHAAPVVVEHTHMAEALAAREQEFRTLAENSPDNICRYDTNCRITYLNRQLAETYGCDAQSVYGKTPTEIDVACADMQARIARVIDTGQADEIEILVPDKDKGLRYHHIRMVAERDVQGRIIGVLSLGRDITERKLIEASLVSREREFRTLAENMPDFIARYDSQGRKTYLNNALIEMIGDDDAAQLGKTPSDSMPADMPGLAEYVEKLRRTLSTGQPESMDGIVNQGPRTGEVHNLRFVAERAQDGSIIGALVFSRDISELKKNESELEESRDLLRELAARRDTAREEERKRIAREVHDELGQMLSAQRLDIATLKFQFAGENPQLVERCQRLLEITDQTIQVVRNVASALRPAVIDIGIRSALSWQADELQQRTGVVCQLHLDDLDLNEEQSLAIFRIVQESLTNITRYAAAQHVHISLEERGDNYCHLAIRDDGKGFDTNNMRRKSFGLIGIRERALMLGGEAQIISSPGLGTAIEVKFPYHATTKGSAE